jgi:hypothetical protein
MKMRLAGLKFLIVDYLHIYIIPGVGLSITHFFPRFVGLNFDLPKQVPESAPCIKQQAIKLKAGKFGCLGSCCACRKLAPASRIEAGRLPPPPEGQIEKEKSLRCVSPKPKRPRTLLASVLAKAKWLV